jgi:hypothetical protein
MPLISVIHDYEGFRGVHGRFTGICYFHLQGSLLSCRCRYKFLSTHLWNYRLTQQLLSARSGTIRMWSKPVLSICVVKCMCIYKNLFATANCRCGGTLFPDMYSKNTIKWARAFCVGRYSKAGNDISNGLVTPFREPMFCSACIHDTVCTWPSHTSLLADTVIFPSSFSPRCSEVLHISTARSDTCVVFDCLHSRPLKLQLSIPFSTYPIVRHLSSELLITVLICPISLLSGLFHVSNLLSTCAV